MRLFWFLLLLLTATVRGQSPANNPVLVLVQQETFNPRVDPDTYVHLFWVRWPAAAPPNGANRILSVATGADWIGSASDVAFDPIDSTGKWRSRSFARLEFRGHFAVRERRLGGIHTGLLRNHAGGTRSEALLTALDKTGPLVDSVGIEEPWPPGKLMVMASDGTDLDRLRRKTKGRILVVEYPPREDEAWSRMWLYGQGWPAGLVRDPENQMPGTVPATRLLPLLASPEQFQWGEAPPNWPGANRWLSYLDGARVAAASVLGASGAVLFLAAVFLAGQERRSPWFVALLRLLALGPAALVLGSAIARVAGLNGSTTWSLLCLLVLGMFSAGVEVLVPRARWAIVALASLLAVLFSNPAYSVFSKGELLGVGLAATAMASASFVSVGLWRKAGLVLFCALMAFCGNCADVWWAQGLLPLWWILATMVGVEWIRDWRLLAGLLLSPGIPALFLHGVTFCQMGLISTSADIGKVNLYDQLTFAISPAVLGTLLLSGAAALFGSSFLAHQLWGGLRDAVAARAMLRVGVSCALGGLFAPSLLHAALWCAMGSTLLVFDTLLKPISLVE